MKIAIIGGTGFLGQRLIQEWKEAHALAIVARHPLKTEALPSVEQIICPFEKAEIWRERLKQFKPDIVVDLIAGDSQHMHTLLKHLDGVTERLVVISSCDVYRAFDRFLNRELGEIQEHPIKESSPLRQTRYLYQNAPFPIPSWTNKFYEKIEVERLALEASHIKATIVRLPMMYGPGDIQHRFLPFLQQMWDRCPAIAIDETFASWKGCWGYIDNAVDAICLAAEQKQASGQIFHVAQKKMPTILEILQLLRQESGWQGKIIITQEAAPLPSLSRLYCTKQSLDLDLTFIEQQLGYQEQITFLDSLKTTLPWESTAFVSGQADYSTEEQFLSQATPLRTL